MGRERKRREGREREGMDQGRGKVTGGMGLTGQYMRWEGREGKGKGGKGGRGSRGATAPKVQFLAPPLLIWIPIS